MGSELLCPRCNLPLKEVRMSHGVFWACDKCAGRAITVELLRRTFTPESINPLGFTQLAAKEEAVVSVLRAESQ